MSFSVWWFHYHTEFVSPYSLPYTATSPLTYEKREYKTTDDIWNEVEEIVIVNRKTSRSIGQDLYYLVPLFTDPNYLIEDWHLEIINEYNMVQNFNISLGELDQIEARRLEHFSLIHNEYNSIRKHDLDNGK